MKIEIDETLAKELKKFFNKLALEKDNFSSFERVENTTLSKEQRLEELIGWFTGEVTMCWSEIEKAGIFKDEKATNLINNLLPKIQSIYK